MKPVAINSPMTTSRKAHAVPLPVRVYVPAASSTNGGTWMATMTSLLLHGR